MQLTKKMICSVIFLTVLAGVVYSQDGIRIRISGNTGTFKKETGAEDILHPLSITYSDTTDMMEFTPGHKLGLEAEIIIPVTQMISFGAEFQNLLLSGYNDNPFWYNFLFSDDNPLFENNLLTYGGQPLSYETSIQNLVGNIRVSPLGDNKFSPFIKLFGGTSFIATDFMLKDPEDRITLNAATLYSVGTSKSDNSKKINSAYYGAGLGINFRLSQSILLYFDASLGFINSDKVDGLPNYNWNDEFAVLEPTNKTAKITKFSFGLSYQFIHGFSLLGNDGSGASGGSGRKTGQTDKYFPFYRRK